MNDKILWTYKTNCIGFFVSTILLFSLSIFCCFVVVKGIEKYLNRNDADLFMTLLLIIATLVCIYPAYILLRLLNQKNIYITKDKLFIEKYLGKTIILSLGTFYASPQSPIWVWSYAVGMTSMILLYKIQPKCPLIPESSFIVPFGANNLDEFYNLLLPKIETYLSTLKEKDYIKCKISIDIDDGMNGKIDFKKIDKLREKNDD